MSGRRLVYVLVVALAAGLSALGGALAGGLAVYSALTRGSPSAPVLVLPPTPAPQAVLQVASTDVETTITQAVEKIGPAVVTVVGSVPGQLTFFGVSPDEQVSGSGVIISPEGYILTNNHVVEDTKELTVILADGDNLPAAIVGADLYADLAVIKAQGAVPSVATLGNSDTLKPGETVIAIGSPLGDFKNSVTVGVVSATGRMIDTGRGYRMEDLVQTDAAINSGNSGGPLINLEGEVVGINTLVVRGSGVGGAIAEGLGFAIPVNTAGAVAEQIIEKGYFSRPYLGIRWQAITPEISAAYRLPVEWGVYVAEVLADSPAAASGLRRGDIITRIGDISLDEEHSYINTIFNYRPGDRITIQVLRGTEQVQLEVTLGEAKN